MHTFQTTLLRLLGAALILCSSACSSLLPQSSSEVSAFKTFDEARTVVEGLQPMHSDVNTLHSVGLDASKNPNITLLTHADVVRRFASGSVVSKQDLNPGVVACIEARDACRGMNIEASRITRNRTGGFFADFFNFSRRTDTAGWRFNAVVLLVDNVVVYRTWGGQPVVNESETRSNPLGPLQDSGPSQVSVPPTVVLR